MTQKIVITETTPAEHWPKVVFAPCGVYPNGTDFLVMVLGGNVHTMALCNSQSLAFSEQPTPDSLKELEGHVICFQSLLEAARWWGDPQPIEVPKPLTFADLAIGDYFVVDDGVFNPTVELKISNEFSTITSWNSIQIFPTSGQRTAFAHDASVTAFRGTIEVKGKE